MVSKKVKFCVQEMKTLIRTNFTHQYKLFQRWLLNLYIIVDQMILYKGLIDRSAILRTNDEGFR